MTQPAEKPAIVVVVCPHRSLRVELPDWVSSVQTTGCKECEEPTHD